MGKLLDIVKMVKFSSFLVWARNLFLFFLLSTVFTVCIYKYLPVYYTPLMFIRSVESRFSDVGDYTFRKQWIPIEEMPSSMINAVIASEDNLFMKHSGFDMAAIEKARKLNQKNNGKVYGASTISQQTAKNVFLWPSRSWIRKGFEAYFTVLIECVWGKKRIMEVYLNVIEMGHGIYGIEAASQYYFNKKAKKMNAQESALVAVCLPSPKKFNPKKPSSYLLKRRDSIYNLMKKINRTEWGVGS